MGTYISSKGEEKDTSTMAYPYLQSALNKAVAEQNEDNIKVLQDELDLRDSVNNGDMSENSINNTDIESGQ